MSKINDLDYYSEGDVYYSEGDVLSGSCSQLTDAWILDFRCSYNMTPNREWFTTYKSGNFGNVYMGNNKACVVVGRGQVHIAMDDGGLRTLCYVWYILELRNNLILHGTLQANGFNYRTDGDRDTLRVCNGVLTMMKAQWILGNIYRLLRSTIIGWIASIESNDDATILWHQRLGHLNECEMPELHKRGLLKGVKSWKLDLYEYCVLGKQRLESGLKLWNTPPSGF